MVHRTPAALGCMAVGDAVPFAAAGLLAEVSTTGGGELIAGEGTLATGVAVAGPVPTVLVAALGSPQAVAGSPGATVPGCGAAPLAPGLPFA